ELLVVRKTVAEHAADIDPLVENRSPAIDIAELSSGKNIFRALLRRCDHGGNFEPGKGALRLTAIAWVNLDIGPRQQCLEAGDALKADGRRDDPETGGFGHVFLGRPLDHDLE